MKITIDIKDNGAVLNIPIGANNDYKRKEVFKFDRDEHTGIQGYVDMLWVITEAVMLFGKYSQERVSINVIHGDNVECKGCDICKP